MPLQDNHQWKFFSFLNRAVYNFVTRAIPLQKKIYSVWLIRPRPRIEWILKLILKMRKSQRLLVNLVQGLLQHIFFQQLFALIAYIKKYSLMKIRMKLAKLNSETLLSHWTALLKTLNNSMPNTNNFSKFSKTLTMKNSALSQRIIAVEDYIHLLSTH